MISGERGQELHQRACRGDNLTASERAELETWYAAMDVEESAGNTLVPLATETNAELRAQIRLRMDELQEALEAIRQTERRNEELRRQNEELKRQLAAKGMLIA